MISDAHLLDWTKAEAADTATLRRLEQAAIVAIQERTGRYYGVVATITEIVRFRGFPIALASAPIGGVLTLLERWDGSAWATVPAADYYVHSSFVFSEARWETLTLTRFRATYQAGYAVDGADANVWAAPADIRQAVLLLVGHWFENRESVVVGTISAEVGQGLDMLLAPHVRPAV